MNLPNNNIRTYIYNTNCIINGIHINDDHIKKYSFKSFDDFYNINRFKDPSKIIDLINDENFNINTPDELLNNLLIILSYKRDIQLLKLLLKRKDLNINYCGFNRKSVLSNMITLSDTNRQIDIDVITLLIEKGANINNIMYSDLNTNPLLYSILSCNIDFFDIFINTNLNIDILNNNLKCINNNDNILLFIIQKMRCEENTTERLKILYEIQFDMLQKIIKKIDESCIYNIIEETINIITKYHSSYHICEKHMNDILNILNINSNSKSASKISC